MAVLRRRARLFSSGVDEPRARRATDVILLVAAVVALALLTLVAVPQAGYERALTTLARAVPSAFDSLWRLLIDLLGLAVLGVVAATVVRRRFSLLRDLVLAALVAFVIAVVVERAALNAWPALSGSLRISGAWFAPLRLSIPAAVAMTASPHLSQPARRVDRWVVLLAALASVLLGASTPTGAVAGLVIGMMAAATVHLVFGSCRGRPSLDDVVVALAGLGVAARSVGAADRQREGVFLVDATDAVGDPLVVKVFGRDANDTQLLTTLWRTVWYREAGSPTSVGRLQQVEHEAFLTLLAAQAGVPTARVVTAGATVEDDVLLVLRPWGRPLATTPERWSDDVAREVWEVLGRLHEAGVSHGQIDDRHLVTGPAIPGGTGVDGADRPGVGRAEGDGSEVAIGLVDFRGGSVAPSDPRLRTDLAQALVATVLALGEERALPVALDHLGPDRLAAVLPFVQMTTLTPSQRRAVRDEGLDLDALRDRAAELAGIEAPELEQMRRVSWSSVIQVVLLIVAFVALSRAIGGVDFAVLGDQMGRCGLVVRGGRVRPGPGHPIGPGDGDARRRALPASPAAGLRVAAGALLHRAGSADQRRAHRGEHPLLPAPRPAVRFGAGRRRARRGGRLHRADRAAARDPRHDPGVARARPRQRGADRPHPAARGDRGDRRRHRRRAAVVAGVAGADRRMGAPAGVRGGRRDQGPAVAASARDALRRQPGQRRALRPGTRGVHRRRWATRSG